MTVATTTAAASYLGDGSTIAFAVPFEFFDAAELVVALISATGTATTQTLGTAYTVSGGAGSIGTVTMTTAPASGTTLHIRRSTARTQTTALAVAGAFPTAAIETRLDRIALQLQELDRADTLAIRGADTDTAMPRLPTRAARAGKALTFDANGDPAATTLTADAVSPLSGWLDVVAAGYVRADGVTDDTAGWRTAAATGRPLYYPGGNSIVTGKIDIDGTGQQILGHPERSIIRGSGSFDTFEFTGNGQGIAGITFESGSKTGGGDIALRAAFRFRAENIRFVDTWTAIVVNRCAGVDLIDVNVTAYRGPRGFWFYGTNAETVRIVRIMGLSAAPNPASAGGPAIEIDGNVTTFYLERVGVNGAPGGASVMTHGIWIRDTVGATTQFTFLTGNNIGIDFPSLDGLRMEVGSVIQIDGFYSQGSATGSGAYLGADTTDITIQQPYIKGNAQHGVFLAGKNTVIANGQIVGNSWFGNGAAYDGVYVDGAADDALLCNLRIGTTGGAGATHRFGVYAASGATRITAVACALAGNAIAPARNDTGLDIGNFDLIGCSGVPATIDGGSALGGQNGFRARATLTIVGGVITGVTITDGGYHYSSAPTVFIADPAGTGSGAVLTATVALGKVTGVTVVSGGTGYSSGTQIGFIQGLGTAGVRVVNSGVVSANMELAAQGAGVVDLRNEQGIAFRAVAGASAVNYLRVDASATGNEVLVTTQGADADVDLALVTKGTGLLRLDGVTQLSAGAISAYLQVKVGGTTYALPLYALS